MLVFRLKRPARVALTVFGPGPSCAKLGTFGRKGRLGINNLLFLGRLRGRALPPGWYAILVQAVRGSERRRVGRVMVAVLSHDGREGGGRPLAVPDCEHSSNADTFAGSGLALDGSVPGSGSPGSTDGSRSPDAGVAGVAKTKRGSGKSIVPPLPTFPAADSSAVPWLWIVGGLGFLSVLAAARVGVQRLRRYREFRY
jgi:hypothetical protein